MNKQPVSFSYILKLFHLSILIIKNFTCGLALTHECSVNSRIQEPITEQPVNSHKQNKNKIFNIFSKTDKKKKGKEKFDPISHFFHRHR